MKGSAHKKRLFYAWILLAVICSQRLIGLVGSDIVYAVEVERQMNATENAIAEEVRRQTGLEVHVEVQDPEQLEFLMNLGYAAPFIFTSETDDGQVHYYTVSDLPATTMETICVDLEEDAPPLPSNPVRASKDRLIADFCFWGTRLPVGAPSILLSPDRLLLSHWQDPFIPVNAPPPRLV